VFFSIIILRPTSFKPQNALMKIVKLFIYLSLALIAFIFWDLSLNQSSTINKFKQNLNLSKKIALSEDDFLRSSKKFNKYIVAIPNPQRAEVFKYLEKHNYSVESILGALTGLSNQEHFESELLYEGLKRHPNQPDLWATLLLNEQDSERLYNFLKENPPSAENSYMTNLWLLNYHFDKVDIKSLMPEFKKITSNPQNLHSSFLLIRQSSYKLYQELGYNDLTAKLKATNPINTMLHTPWKASSKGFVSELSCKIKNQLENYGKSESALTSDDYSQLIYHRFEIRNSILRSEGQQGPRIFYIQSEYEDLKQYDPMLEYGDSGMTVKDMMNKLKLEIDNFFLEDKIHSDIFTDFFDNHLFSGNRELLENYFSLQLKYEGQELQDQLLKFATDAVK
jgi:hypothetical protein